DGTIGNEQLKAASITTDKLRVGVATNTVIDPSFSNSELTTLRLPASSNPAVGSLVTIDGTNYLEAITDETAFRFWIAGFQHAQQATTSPAFSLTDTNGWVPVQPGQQWLFSSMCMSS